MTWPLSSFKHFNKLIKSVLLAEGYKPMAQSSMQKHICDKCLSMDELIKCVCIYTHTYIYIYTMEYLAIKRRKSFIYSNLDGLDGIMLSEVSYRKANTL